MTLDETHEQLPNGFHDAEIERFEFNPVAETLHIDMLLWVGTMDDPPSLRERYRRGQIRFSGVDFFSLPTPRAKPMEWIILALEQEPYTAIDTIYPLQNERERRLSAVKIWSGYSELLVAAETFEFVWFTESEINRNP